MVEIESTSGGSDQWNQMLCMLPVGGEVHYRPVGPWPPRRLIHVASATSSRYAFIGGQRVNEPCNPKLQLLKVRRHIAGDLVH